ncbi:MAG: response regulator [Clostridia bacterium]|nr:response regulator [Clostridia bacterium]
MIRAFLVDDEKPALRELQFLLKQYPEIEVEGIFTNPLEALAQIEKTKPQVVFLDIHMAQLKGIDAASAILAKNPQTQIVFVTAYDQYAIEAFELHALDYLLKPLNQERLAKTIVRLLKGRNPIRIENAESQKLHIRCLGRFELAWDGQEPIKWRTEKTKELFCFLLHHRGRDLSKDELLEGLWPEEDPERAMRQLYNGVYYIRRALEDYGVSRELVSVGSNYSLSLGPVAFDSDAFQRLIGSSRRLSREELLKLEQLYNGDYFEGDFFHWSDIEREHFRNHYLQALIELAKACLADKEYSEAEAYLVKAYRKNPYEEDVTELLMRLYILSDNKSKAVRHFNAYSRLIMEELRIKPNNKLTALLQDN